MSVRLAISCCNNLFGEGLKSLFENEKDIEVVGVFSGDKGFLPGLEDMLKIKPDVILGELHGYNDFLFEPYEDSFEANLKILLIGDRSLPFISGSHLKKLISRGVVGILPPGADSDLLKKALKAINMGELWLDRKAIMKLLTLMKNRDTRANLAKREKEIVVHICHGYRNKEIAQKLNICEQTVKSHCTRIYKKLGVSDRKSLQ